MSKSLGNFFTIRQVLERYDAEVIRFFILRAHYRSPLNYSDVHLDDARVALARLYTALKDTVPDDGVLDLQEPFAQRFAEAMNDDFNTPMAMSVLFDLANETNKSHSPVLARQLKLLSGLLGLLARQPQQFLQASVSNDGIADDEIAVLIAARAQAKKDKNFSESDRLRAELAAKGIVLEDKPGGLTEWRRA
jgi:cysteinyl-tRNA synthetase